MDFPTGITTRGITMSIPFGGGTGVSLFFTGTITPTGTLIYAPVGADAIAVPPDTLTVTVTNATSFSAILPVTDQANTWQDGQGNWLQPGTDGYTHRYTLAGHFSDSAGNTVGSPVDFIFVLPHGDTAIDLDALIPVSGTAGTTYIPDTWSTLLAETEAAATTAATAAATTNGQALAVAGIAILGA